MVVNAWTVRAGDDNDARRVLNSRPFYRLAVRSVSPNGRELSAEVYEGQLGGTGYIGPCSTVAFQQSDWYRAREAYRFVIEGSGLWQISNVMDMESAPNGSPTKSAVLYLTFERPSPN